MNADDFFPSKYLKPHDVKAAATVTISHVTSGLFKNKETGVDELKPILHFHGGIKPYLCNKTNWGVIVGLYGKDLAGMSNKQITLVSEPGLSFGEMIDLIKVKAPVNGATAPDMKQIWQNFCKANGITENHIRQALGTEKVSEWITRDVGNTLERAMQLVKEIAAEPF